MSPRLRPLQLPLLVEERRKREEEEAAQRELEVDVPYNIYTVDSYSSDATSPVTPTFSARGHLRCSSSMSSFDLATVASSDSPSSPTQTAQSSGKRVLPDVEEEPIEFEDEFEDSDVDYDDASELYHCLCDEPCIHRDTDLVQSTSNFYRETRSAEYDAGFFSDGDFSFSLRSSLKRRRDGSESPFAGLSQRLGSRFPSFSRWKSSKPSSISSPVSDYAFDQQPIMSRTSSSRSSSISASFRHRLDRSNEPPVLPTPALSRNGSSDRMPLDLAVDARKATELLFAIQHERKQTLTPLLPPMMTSTSSEYILAQPSPLQSPSVACSPLLFEEEIYATGMISPPLSAKGSHSSLRLMPDSVELSQLPAPDAWSDRLGHANYTIVPKPYEPEMKDLCSLRQFRSDWEAARVNYTKHLARTGEHYGQTSKTYSLTEEKWAETQRVWRKLHDEIAEAVVASGEATDCDKFDEAMLTTVPRMDAEGKFPERGDEDIVGPMVREATMMTLDNADRKGPGFWRHLAGKVGLRK
ncbi:uncharacterized protein GGS22DRAFT_137709 [Annulohypoxylon maeteangense]|uniref:uncharacterized protein n=1 Tax=Annulohypoxylon maeteangense TaxID=1927788 RepID=UPI002008E8DD|nr:uncharacterized protein GGS22DRAFT_137709 [Annulohypoxylon maeteangense]KAI0885043.1 hypothetical protein GGS22DRAFT_137709 [Annulohypoxylon maeteangense]